MKRKSILLVLCIGMVLTSCKNIKTLNDSDVKNEKSQKKTVMEIQDKGYDLPIDEKKKKEVVNDCEENMEAIRDCCQANDGSDERDYQTKWKSGKGFRSLFCYGKLSEDGNVFECCQARRKRQRNFI